MSFTRARGVKFHEGSDFDAEVVRWNYQRAVDPDEDAFIAPFLSIVDSVEVIDAHTKKVKFTLKHPTRTLLPTLAINRVGFLQMSPASYKRWGKDEVRLHPDGTGPFKLGKWEQNRIVVLEKNPHYFKPGLPYLDRVELQIIKEGVTRVTALRAGKVDRYPRRSQHAQSSGFARRRAHRSPTGGGDGRGVSEGRT